MRTTRAIAAIVAFVLAAMAPLALTSEASAAGAEQAKEKHALFASGKEIGNTNKFIAFGRVSTYKNRTITVQRKNCAKCGWKFYKKVRTSRDKGAFRTRIAPGARGTRICYKVVVPATARYRTTKRVVGCITTS
jgi:hypothetical protein